MSFLELTFQVLRLGWVEKYEELGKIIVKHGEICLKHLVDFLRFYSIVPSLNEGSKKEKTLEESNDQKKTQQTDSKDRAKSTYLSCCHISLCCCRNKKQQEVKREEKQWIPPSITELFEAGVNIKKAEKSLFITDVSFKNGVLEISPVVIDDYFETISRNAIAFEHLDSKNDQEMDVISYVSFMDYLISTEKDVSLLVNAGIIINDIGGNHKEVSKLFNNLGKFVKKPRHGSAYFRKFNGISKDLREHCDRRWNKMKATLRHNYFNTPWAGISVFAAIFIIVLTVLQTIFSAKSAFQ